METKKIITEAIDAVLGTGDQSIINRIKDGGYKCVSCVKGLGWGKKDYDIWLELANENDESDTLKVGIHISYDAWCTDRGSLGDHGTYRAPEPASYAYDNVAVDEFEILRSDGTMVDIEEDSDFDELNQVFAGMLDDNVVGDVVDYSDCE